MPRRNISLWKAKFMATIRRDSKNLAMLREAGWDVLVVWECETADLKMLAERIRDFWTNENLATSAYCPRATQSSYAAVSP
jgi:DNA mismatch endonuclease (patch repair protein)